MKIKNLSKVALVVVLGFNLPVSATNDKSEVTRAQVLTSNADIAYAAYADSLTSAKALKIALKSLATTPTEQTFAQAKQAWLDAREPYGQTEVYRFRVGPIDALKADGTLG
jgi:putative iron-regulated protein